METGFFAVRLTTALRRRSALFLASTLAGLCLATAVSAGEEHALALLSSGEVVAWGNNFYHQLGDVTATEESKVPVPVCAVGAAPPCSEESKQLKAIAIAAGGDHSLALLSGGEV